MIQIGEITSIPYTKYPNNNKKDTHFTYLFEILNNDKTPIEIIKSIEETYDPNIVIANKLKKAAELVGSPDLSIIPYSSLLMLYPGIPVVPPLGFIYWGISALETINNTAKGNNSYGFDFDRTESGPQKKNPLNSSC
jgi:hypothetical protein